MTYLCCFCVKIAPKFNLDSLVTVFFEEINVCYHIVRRIKECLIEHKTIAQLIVLDSYSNDV